MKNSKEFAKSINDYIESGEYSKQVNKDLRSFTFYNDCSVENLRLEISEFIEVEDREKRECK